MEKYKIVYIIIRCTEHYKEKTGQNDGTNPGTHVHAQLTIKDTDKGGEVDRDTHTYWPDSDGYTWEQL